MENEYGSVSPKPDAALPKPNVASYDLPYSEEELNERRYNMGRRRTVGYDRALGEWIFEEDIMCIRVDVI